MGNARERNIRVQLARKGDMGRPERMNIIWMDQGGQQKYMDEGQIITQCLRKPQGIILYNSLELHSYTTQTYTHTHTHTHYIYDVRHVYILTKLYHLG